MLVKCEGKLSLAELNTLTFALLQLRLESRQMMCKLLAEDVLSRLNEDRPPKLAESCAVLYTMRNGCIQSSDSF